MKCPCCGAAKLIHDTSDMSYAYQGRSTVIPGVTGDFCPTCGAIASSREHGERHIELVGVFLHQMSAVYSAHP